MLLLLLLIGGGSYAWGEEKTAQFGTDWNALFGTEYTGKFSLKANELNLSGTVNSVDVTVANGTSTNGFVKTGDFRAYNGYTIIFTAPEGNNITAITSAEGGKTFTSGVTADTGTLDIENNAISWTGSANAVKLTISGTVSFKTITVTYTTSGGGTPTTPSLNVNTTSIDFGTVEQNAVVEAKTVSVSLKNVTSANVKLTGEGASAFEVSPAVLTVSDDVTITPKTTSVGTYTAKLEISADGAETQSVDVSMTVRESFDGSVWEIKGTDLGSANGYDGYKGEHGPVRGFTFYIEKVMKSTTKGHVGEIQFQKNTGFLYNTTSFSNIVKIELETSSTFTVYVGKAEHPESQEVKGTSVNGVVAYNFPEGNGYFTIKNNNSKNAGYISSIKVYYNTSPSEPTYTTNTLTFKASNKDGNWATFSNDDVTFFNDDVIVNTVVVENNSLVSLPLDKTTANIGGKEVKGYYVPAKTGVLIYSIGETVTYYVVKNKEVAPVDGDFNMLKPASEKMTEGFKFYKLAYDNYTEKTGLGFYWGAAEGGAFTVKPGLAYLAVPQAQAANVKGFSFDGTQTGINGVEATTAKGAIYNLNGQRVEKAQRGIYIQNGKKFIVK